MRYFGKYYFDGTVDPNRFKTEEIYFYADEVIAADGGILIAMGRRYDDNWLPEAGGIKENLILTPGCWYSVFPASITSGAPMAVEH